MKISIIHQIEKTYSYIKFHGINFHNSFTNLIFESKNNIKPLADIYSEQSIKAIVMDNAKFSGIPQIDAANNSFTSAHKLAVGSLDKDELFYLNSLGINKIDSINIILQSLYNSLLMNYNDEKILAQI
ncbi:SufD family Fe-S cluster assembly protein [bacterium]|nr:SufD family Fe-S cluster assembly protein [bacterium]